MKSKGTRHTVALQFVTSEVYFLLLKNVRSPLVASFKDFIL